MSKQDIATTKDAQELPMMTENTAIERVIENAIMNPDIDVEKLERLLDMQERIIDKAAKQEFNAAMTTAQSEMSPISADAVNPQTRSKYASYAALDNKLRPIYTRNGFSLSFDSGEGAPDGCVRVLCYVGHRNGYTRTYHADMPADGKGAKGGDVMTKTHAAGAAFSYGQRYLLKFIFNVAIGEADTDGNAPSTFITNEQAEAIKTLAKEAQAEIAPLLNWKNVDSLSEIPLAEYDSVIKALEKKKEAS